jgi:hypothetical protein
MLCIRKLLTGKLSKMLVILVLVTASSISIAHACICASDSTCNSYCMYKQVGGCGASLRASCLAGIDHPCQHSYCCCCKCKKVPLFDDCDCMLDDPGPPG